MSRPETEATDLSPDQTQDGGNISEKLAADLEGVTDSDAVQQSSTEKDYTSQSIDVSSEVGQSSGGRS